MESLGTPVFTTIYVLEKNSLITCITHEIDGDWQFMGPEPLKDFMETALLVPLEKIILCDPSVQEVAELPRGCCATRTAPFQKWIISRIRYSLEK
jgi:hypothetical protein